VEDRKVNQNQEVNEKRSRMEALSGCCSEASGIPRWGIRRRASAPIFLQVDRRASG
jgi:hypothetical protein